MMDYRILGPSSFNISAIAFGCMSLKTSADENAALLKQAFDAGINFFDTADLYEMGANEVLVGKALRDMRKEVFIATKVGNRWRPDGSGWDWVPGKEYILQAVDKSLKRLQTDYIDLYQLHGGTMDDPIEEIIETFEMLKEQGKIKAYGISSIRPQVIREYVERSGITSVMMQYSLLDKRPEETIMPLLEDQHIGMLARGVLAQGLLAGKPATAYLDHPAQTVQDAARLVNDLSVKERTPAQTAIRYVLQQPALTAAVIGIRTQEQLKEVLQTMDMPMLTADELEQLNHVPAITYQQHR